MKPMKPLMIWPVKQDELTEVLKTLAAFAFFCACVAMAWVIGGMLVGVS